MLLTFISKGLTVPSGFCENKGKMNQAQANVIKGFLTGNSPETVAKVTDVIPMCIKYTHNDPDDPLNEESI